MDLFEPHKLKFGNAAFPKPRDWSRIYCNNQKSELKEASVLFITDTTFNPL